MLLSQSLRKLALTAHVTSSVGFFGAVAAFLCLAIAGLMADDPDRAGAAYVAMEITSWAVIVPLSFAALFTGMLQSLGTAWGVFRHYWVVVKVFLTVITAAVLLVHTQPVGTLAHVAVTGTVTDPSLRELRVQLIAASAAGLLVLLVATFLSIYKPRGLTPYGWRKQQAERTCRPPLDAEG